jgi:hypothetical protein
MAIIVICLIRGTLSDDFWISYFKIQIFLFVLMKLITLVWFGAGAVKDSIELARNLKTVCRDVSDDGWVEK